MADYKFDPKYSSPEQLAYANLLDIGWKAGFLLMVILFGLYVFDIVPPHTPMDQLTKYWVLPAHEYMEKVHGVHGWGWTAMLNRGDYLNFLGITMMAGITLVCFLRVLPLFLKKGETVYSVIIVLEVLVLSLAASGILAVGGH